MLNDAGDVTIVGADVDTAQVNVTKKAYANSQAKADEAVKAIKYSITQMVTSSPSNMNYPT